MPTVQQVWRLALPETVRLLNANGDLSRQVSWAQRMAHHAPAFAALEAGELALLSVDAIHMLDERLSLARVVGALAQREVAALAVVGEVPQKALLVADLHLLCVFGLPHDTDLRDVEKDIVRLIVEWEAQLDRRGRQVYRQLAQLSIENRGLPAIAKALVRIVGRPVVIQDERMAVRALELRAEASVVGSGESLPSSAGGAFTSVEIEAEVADRAPVARWLLDRPLDDKSPPCTELSLERPGWARCVAAVVVEGRLGGYLSILGMASELDDLDHLATGLFGAKVLGGHPVYGLELADWLPQLGVQALGALTIAAFVGVCGLILFFVLNKFKMLRVVRDAELFGIDIALHKTYAYPEEMADQQFGR